MGEILGLSWKNVHIEDEDIATDNAYIYIDAELERASKQAIETLGKKDIYHIFTPLMPNTSTRLVLKKPKTDSSIRKVWLPKTVAYILRDWRKAQNELKGFLGGEYQDFDLVVALPNGRPCEARIINKEFVLLKEKAGLPNVVFHSLRHSSTTYKLKLNHGDLKATQGDTGHAEIDMITKVYAHISLTRTAKSMPKSLRLLSIPIQISTIQGLRRRSRKHQSLIWRLLLSSWKTHRSLLIL